MSRLKLALLCLILAWSATAHAGEALVTRVRGSRLAIDMGAEAGLMVGMEVTVVRPPGEAVVHPITGENLGAPELQIGRAVISKTSGRAATLQMSGSTLLAVRPGDVVRFVTPEEEMLQDQERQVATQERNDQDHQGFRSELSILTRGIKSIQSRIGSLEEMMRRVERVEEGFRVQLRGINTDINTMKEDIKTLKDQVALYGPIPVEGMGEQREGAGGLDLGREEDVAQLRAIITGVVEEMQPPVQAPAAAPAQPQIPADDLTLPPVDDDLLQAEEPSPPFYTQSWFLGLLGALGIIGVAAFLYLKMTAASEEDEEDEADEEEAEEEDADEVEVEDDEEQDDIVVDVIDESS